MNCDVQYFVRKERKTEVVKMQNSSEGESLVSKITHMALFMEKLHDPLNRHGYLR